MTDRFIAGGFTAFPHHKRTDAQKTKEYFKQTVDAGVSMCSYDDSMGLRASRKNKLTNYRLINGEVDDKEVQAVLNPFGIEYGSLPADYQNCPLINSNLMVLFGEERKRFTMPMVTVVNNDAVSQKMDDINLKIDEFLQSQIVNPSMSEEQIQQELEKLNKWKNYTHRDKRELMATQILEYLIPTLEIPMLTSRGFEDLTIAGEEIYVTDIIGGEPRAFKADTVSTVTIRGGHSYKIEDSDVIIFDEFIPIGQCIDMYFDELTNAQIKELEEGGGLNKAAGRGFMGKQLSYGGFEDYVNAVGIGGLIVQANKKETFAFGGSYDNEGNVRRTRVLWKGMRKVGVLTYFDEEGQLQKTIIPEQYAPDEELGEMVKWIWISEWYEGTKIANDIYLKMGPRPVQFRHLDNPSISSPGVVGTLSNVGNQSARSIVDLAKPYQYLYNAVLTFLKADIARDKGSMFRLDVSMIPEGWSMDKWMYYAEIMGWQVVDPFNEVNKGTAMGKLAGHMNQNSPVIQSNAGEAMQHKLLLLDFLSGKIDEITGINDQRKGAIQNRETLGGIERAVTQSSLRTEKWFALHDNTKIRFYEALLETTKEAWKGKSFKKSYVLDDMSTAILDFDSDVFCEAEYGVFISDSAADIAMMDTLKSLAQPFMQNGGSLSLVADLFRTKNPSSFQRKLETYEQQQQEAAQQQQEAAMEIENAKMEFEKYKVDEDNATRIQIALINKGEDTGEIEREKLDRSHDIEIEKAAIAKEKLNKESYQKARELDETKRHNIETEGTDRIKARTVPKTK